MLRQEEILSHITENNTDVRSAAWSKQDGRAMFLMVKNISTKYVKSVEVIMIHIPCLMH